MFLHKSLTLGRPGASSVCSRLIAIFKKYILCGLFAAGLTAFTGCDDLFRDTPVDKMSEKDIWKNPMLLDEYVLPWYRNMNSGFSTYVPTTIALVKSASRYYMPWFGDQIVPSKNDYYNAGYGDLLKGNTKEITNWSQVQWSKYYKQIQSVNRLFVNQGEIAEGSQKQRILGEAHFFRAYYYYMLWRQFGGVMLIREPLDPLNDRRKIAIKREQTELAPSLPSESDLSKYPRASYEEMVRAIVDDARAAATALPLEYDATDVGRVTQGAALMLVAKTFQWASSNVFQNQEKTYLGFTDDRSRDMLDSARVAYETLMGLQHYDLIQIAGTDEESIKQEYRNIFLTKNSKESILEVQHSDDGNYDTGFGHKLDRDAAAPHFTGTTAAYTPTQNHVDEYGMRAGFTYDAQHPYVGRDYRFYANILYDGSTYNGHVMDIHYTREGNNEIPGEDLTAYGTSTTAALTRTGYYMGKFVNEKQQINNDEAYASSQNYIIWRYAEALLDYAEVMFRLGDTETARAQVNAIRRRAHMDELPSLTWEQLVNERRVELAFEETTYWDFFRWGIAEEKLNGTSNPLKAMKIVKIASKRAQTELAPSLPSVSDLSKSGETTTYSISNMNRFPQRVRVFQRRQYYLPIPWDEIRYHGIDQNPDWVEV